MTDSKKIKLSLVSLGCDKNLVESEIMLGLISRENKDFAFVPEMEKADCIIINTCGFLKDAIDEAAEHINYAVSLKEKGSCNAIIVAGCMVQRFKEKTLADFQKIDKIVSNTNDIVKTLYTVYNKSSTNSENIGLHSIRAISTPSHYAYLKIAEGCNNCCTYCAIPLIKGRYKSRPFDDILKEARFLAEKGVREIILIAQDTSLYGSDLYNEKILHRLIREISLIDEIKWIRIMYCYPEHITDDLIDEIAKNPKVCKYIDIPVQHSSDRILKLMGRNNDGRRLRELISKLREAVPDIILRTTVIAGFPGETKEDFKNLLNFLEEMKFDRLGAFAYSKEEGTPAFDMDNQLDEKTKEARKNRIMANQRSISANKLKKFVGKKINVIIDGYASEDEIYMGRSFADAPDVDGLVFIETENSDAELVNGEFYDVLITEALEYDLYGSLKNVSLEFKK